MPSFNAHRNPPSLMLRGESKADLSHRVLLAAWPTPRQCASQGPIMLRGGTVIAAAPVRSRGKPSVLLVTRLDRLARSTRDLLNTLAAAADKGAGFRSLRDTWADTTTPHGRLMLTVLGGLAEFERELIRTRTGEGRERAKARGVRMCRKPKLTPDQRKEALDRRSAGEPLVDIARTYAVSHSTISRLR
jgi:DNA invertase Pin-like site-specific DNA recombinase